MVRVRRRGTPYARLDFSKSLLGIAAFFIFGGKRAPSAVSLAEVGCPSWFLRRVSRLVILVMLRIRDP